MSEPFIYQWQEGTKGRDPADHQIIISMLLSGAVGLVFLIKMVYFGFRFGAVLVAAGFLLIFITLMSLQEAECRRKGIRLTNSELRITTTRIELDRYVISNSGRLYKTQWELKDLHHIAVDESHRVIRIYGLWQVSAYKMKRGKRGDYVDYDKKEIPQTILLSLEAFQEAVYRLKSFCPDKIQPMTQEEWAEAKFFVKKHGSM